jgi:hypothetical protein
MKKPKTQPGGSLKPVGSVDEYEVRMTERYSYTVRAKSRCEAIIIASTLEPLPHRVTCDYFMYRTFWTRKMPPNENAQRCAAERAGM